MSILMTALAGLATAWVLVHLTGRRNDRPALRPVRVPVRALTARRSPRRR